ncbi:hypothetical protein [Agromyces laixinhei]|uniref:hypothetical protein n=1 Tax=Agromyces laixinhei TaxID=2585717 RepID=UPI0012ED2B21|nr:hypothetical protein [Agromyces laixinhei]
MTLPQYLQEDGSGSYSSYRVPDLTPPAGVATELLLVLESPHIDELRNGIPVSGGTGQAALKFLLPAGFPPEALGPFVATRHANNDFRIAILNVSPVPLQRKAFAGHRSPPKLAPDDWAVMAEIQKSQAKEVADLGSVGAQTANMLLAPGLQSRIGRMTLSPRALIFTAGTFVQRTWTLLLSPPSRSTLPIPHPSMGWWTRTERAEHILNLAELRTQFAKGIT